MVHDYLNVFLRLLFGHINGDQAIKFINTSRYAFAQHRSFMALTFLFNILTNIIYDSFNQEKALRLFTLFWKRTLESMKKKTPVDMLTSTLITVNLHLFKTNVFCTNACISPLSLIACTYG